MKNTLGFYVPGTLAAIMLVLMNTASAWIDKDIVEAHKWVNLAGTGGRVEAGKVIR